MGKTEPPIVHFVDVLTSETMSKADDPLTAALGNVEVSPTLPLPFMVKTKLEADSINREEFDKAEKDVENVPLDLLGVS